MAYLEKQHHQTKEWERDCIKTRRSMWLRDRRLNMFSIPKNAFVLDLGCGDGLNTKILTQNSTKIVGIDISNYLLKLAQNNNPEVGFILASADKLPFKANIFDEVLVDSVFHHLINHPKTMAEINRVLKRGGYLNLAEPHKSVWRKIFDFLTLLPLAYIIPYLKTRRSAYLAEKELMNNWLETENDFLSSVEKNGFKKIFLKYDILSIICKYQKI